ncbi:MAG: M20/M25/M40 family metallo-hydrolase [Proteobacteria bacterium]|nr:M20/M25/M40 family metallo-hydrolase [Pseudomonadota bacterium]
MDENLQTRIRDNLVANRAGQFQFVGDLVKTPSPNPPGDTDAVTELAIKALKDLGLGVERHPAAPRSGGEASDAPGAPSVTNLVVRHEFASGPVVALVAHGDTGPATDDWTKDPFGAEIQDGVLYGLGVLSKADIAVYAHALVALRDARPDLSGTVELHVTFDGMAEGVRGPKWLLDNGIVNPDYALASGLAYGIGTSSMGDLRLEVEVEAKAPGADALEAAGGVLNALYELRGSYGEIQSDTPGIGSPTLVIGEIEGGSRVNQAPEKVMFRLDRRLIPEEDPKAVEAGLTNLIAITASRFDGIVCRIRRLRLWPPMKPGPGTDKLSGTLERQAAEVMGGPIWVYGVPFDANSRHYAALDIPTVLYGAGPATMADAHAGEADERLVLDDLRKATEIVALSLADFLTPAA